jgi:hypothetical protein
MRNHQDARNAFPWLDRISGNDTQNSHVISNQKLMEIL